MPKLEWKNCRVKLGDLKPWADNPRFSTKAQAERLIKQLDELGQFQTLSVGPSLEVYDGHQRLSAWMTIHGAGYEIDARQSNRPLTDAERRRIVFAANVQAGNWDADKLAAWDAPSVLEWAGVDASAWQNQKREVAMWGEMLAAEKQEPPEDAEPQIDRAAELQEKWKTERGQLWAIGEHRLLCGDSTVWEDVERVMGGESAAICFTSPPYNAGVSAKLRGNTSIGENFYKDEYNDNKSAQDYLLLLSGFTSLAISVSQYVFVNIQPLAGNKRALIEYWYSFVNKFADVAIWDKLHAAPAQARRVMDSRFEFVIVFSENASRAIGTRDFRGMIHNVYASQPQRNNEFSDMHAATFPIELPSHFIETFTNDSELVYEPFAGSGTTLVACQNLGRKCRAIEISPAYVAVCLERMATAFPALDIHLVDIK